MSYKVLGHPRSVEEEDDAGAPDVPAYPIILC